MASCGSHGGLESHSASASEQRFPVSKSSVLRLFPVFTHYFQVVHESCWHLRRAEGDLCCPEEMRETAQGGHAILHRERGSHHAQMDVYLNEQRIVKCCLFWMLEKECIIQYVVSWNCHLNYTRSHSSY